MKSWFSIDGNLEPIEFEGPSYFRFPKEMVEIILQEFSVPGDWALDPFCGFGTTIHVAQEMGRHAIGFEKEPNRAAFAGKGIEPPNRIIHDSVANLENYDLPIFDLLLTSPPFTSFRDFDDEEARSHYFDDLRDYFLKIKKVMKPGARIIVEASNVRNYLGVRTLAWEIGKTLAEIFTFEGEMIRCNTGTEEAGPGYDHSYLLVYTNLW